MFANELLFFFRFYGQPTYTFTLLNQTYSESPLPLGHLLPKPPFEMLDSKSGDYSDVPVMIGKDSTKM